MKLLRRILFSLVPVVLLAGGAEALCRFAGWPRRVERPFEHNEVYWLTDPDLREKPFPHRETGSSFTVSTDERGLRYPHHALEKPPGAFRILFLGCSTTFGWGVDDAATYPAQVEAMLHRGGLSQVEVLNGGQPGYTSFQGLWFYREVARAYRPDLVFFGYLVQDARRAAYSDASQALLQQDARFLKHDLLYRSRAYLALRSALDDRRIRTKERDEEGEEGVFRVSREDYVQNIRSFLDLTREDGARLALFGFPLEREGYTTEHRRLLRAAAAELDLPHLDPQGEVERLTRSRTLYFPEDRGHANADGNALIATWVVEFLRTHALLPPEPRHDP